MRTLLITLLSILFAFNLIQIVMAVRALKATRKYMQEKFRYDDPSSRTSQHFLFNHLTKEWIIRQCKIVAGERIILYEARGPTGMRIRYNKRYINKNTGLSGRLLS